MAERLLDRMRRIICVKRYSHRTEKSYIQWVRRFIRFHGLRHPRELGKSEIEAYLTHLAVERHVAAAYERAFQGQSGSRLIRAFKNDLDGLREAARQVGGEPLPMGDAVFRFWALPRIPLAVVYWAGDEEFPASAQVLFDASACSYHDLEILAHLGATICEKLIAIYEGRR